MSPSIFNHFILADFFLILERAFNLLQKHFKLFAKFIVCEKSTRKTFSEVQVLFIIEENTESMRKFISSLCFPEELQPWIDQHRWWDNIY